MKECVHFGDGKSKDKFTSAIEPVKEQYVTCRRGDRSKIIALKTRKSVVAGV